MKVKAQIDRFIGKDNRIKAYASVILGGEYVIRDIAVTDSKNGLFARMPYRSYKDRNGNMQYSDVAFALNETSRNAVSDAVLEAYEQRLHMEEDESQDLEEPDEDEAPVFAQGHNFFHGFVFLPHVLSRLSVPRWLPRERLLLFRDNP